jgi:predicted permease
MDFPVHVDVNPDWRVFLFSFAASLFAGLFFGSVPAWRALKANANAVLKGAQLSWGYRRMGFRDLLVVVQVALCFVLVSGCLLSLEGLREALRMRLGFEPKGVSVVGFELGLAGYSKEQGQNFQRRALDRVRQLPGVRAVAYSNSLPLSIDQSHTTVYPAGEPALQPSDGTTVNYYQVSPGFFETMATKLLAGRDFNWHDDGKSPTVAIVNVAFGKQVLHADNPLGKRFRYGLNGPLATVIGMVEDGKYDSLTESLAPVAYQPILQSYNSTTTLIARSSLTEAETVREMHQAVTRLDPDLPLYGTGSLEQMLGFAFFPTRAAATALSAFGVLAIMLAATGIHGLLSYAVAKRIHEIGIRMAIGARRWQVLQLMLARMGVLLVAGTALGLVLALAVGQVLRSIVYQASPRDPLVLTAVTITILIIGLLSSWVPARRATRVDPMVALRYE